MLIMVVNGLLNISVDNYIIYFCIKMVFKKKGEGEERKREKKRKEGNEGDE